MAVAARIERPYRVRFDEAGPDGIARSSDYLRYAQDLAWIHSEGAGFGRDWYAAQRLTWLIRAVELDILEHVPYGAELIATTEVLGFRRVWARRRSEFRVHGAEREVATAIVDWVLLNERGVPIRVPAPILELFDPDTRGTFTPLRLELPAPPATATRAEFAVRRSELDPLAHVNNAAYIDYVDAHLAGVGRSATLRRVPRRYRLEFVAPAEPDMSVVGRGWDDERAWDYRLESTDGLELLRARVESDPAQWVGG